MNRTIGSTEDYHGSIQRYHQGLSIPIHAPNGDYIQLGVAKDTDDKQFDFLIRRGLYSLYEFCERLYDVYKDAMEDRSRRSSARKARWFLLCHPLGNQPRKLLLIWAYLLEQSMFICGQRG